MKKKIILIPLLLTASLLYADDIDTLINQTNFTKTVKEVNKFNDLKTQIYWIAGIVSAVLIVLAALGGKALLDSAITKTLADKLNVKKEHLEEMLKEMTKEYDAKNNRKILIISNHSEQTIADMRNLLLSGGIKNGNFSFQGINDTLNLTDKDVILFNDAKNSQLTISEMEAFIAKYKFQIKSYFYFGKENQLPIAQWKEKYGIGMSAANMDERLANGLLNFFKSIN
jgi:hypothetical protein